MLVSRNNILLTDAVYMSAISKYKRKSGESIPHPIHRLPCGCSICPHLDRSTYAASIIRALHNRIGKPISSSVIMSSPSYARASQSNRQALFKLRHHVVSIIRARFTIESAAMQIPTHTKVIRAAIPTPTVAISCSISAVDA